MKKILTILSLLVATSMFGQDTMTYVNQKKVKTPITPYVSVGLSMSNMDNFRNGTYFGLESGVCIDNLSLGVVLGRGSVSGAFKSGDKSSNYFYEAKSSGSFPLGKLNGVVFFGVGGYFNTSHMFIEYGTGFYYQSGHVSYGVSYSNWDNVNYVTPNVTYNF
jgi:hypothetical protein